MSGKLVLLFLMLMMSPACLVQTKVAEQESHPRRAVRFYQQSLEAYRQRDFNQALQFTKKAYAIDQNYTRAYLLAGDIAMEMNNHSTAITYYEKAVTTQPEYYPPAYYILGNLYFQAGKYEKAYGNFRHYSGFKLPPQEQLIVEQKIKQSAAARDLKNNPVPFDPVNLCDDINTKNDEYVNAISADGKTLIFTVRSPWKEARSLRQFREKFYMSNLVDGAWTRAQPMKYLSGDSESEGALSLSYDNRYIFFTSCHQPDGYGSCDLYYSARQGEQWTDPVNLGPVVNSSRWESQPSLSSDGRTLYFASNRPGGFGGSDIWKTVLQDDGSWSRPENLGDVINTAEDEMSPYIHADGQTLYFSSHGHPGLGGADLFMSRKLPGKNWSEPLNLGYPINTIADEINLIVHPGGSRAYISSDMPLGKGGYDIYTFELYDDIRPKPVSYVKGIIRDINTLAPLKAGIELIELEKGATVVQSYSDPVNGEFITVLPAGTNYALNVNSKGYLFHSHHFALDSMADVFDPFTLDIFLKPIAPGHSVILKNVFFAYDSYELKNASRSELNKLVSFLNENQGVELEISGHTDNTGSSAYNKALSENRAKAVFEYLVNAGIDKNRISYIGIGEKKPVDTNDTPEGRANNRRTEFTIINKTPD
jgi:outer membrane protein OmpA-like peptidoglycan-associated protein